MVIDGIIDILFGTINTLLSPMQNMSFDLDITKIEPILQYFKMAMYIIPFQELLPIFHIFIALMSFRIIVSLIKTIWGLLPIA